MVDVFVNVISLAGENDGTSNDVRRAHTNLSRQIDLDVIEIGRGLHSLLFGSHWNDASFCGVHHAFASIGHDHADCELPHVWLFDLCSRFWFCWNDAVIGFKINKSVSVLRGDVDTPSINEDWAVENVQAFRLGVPVYCK